MRIGISTDTTRIELIKDAGYDYIEFALSELAKFTDEEFEEVVKRVEATGLKVEAVNGFYNATQCIVGPEADLVRAREYAQKNLARAKRLGVEQVVFGNGGFRKTPEGQTKEETMKQLDDAIIMMAEECAKFGMTLVIEHLQFKETDTYNYLAEVIDTVKRLNIPNLRALVDFYHLYMVDESLDVVKNSGGLITHAHIARNNPDRHVPYLEEDRAACIEWKAALDACGYDARISVEAGYKGIDDYGAAVKAGREFLKIFE